MVDSPDLGGYYTSLNKADATNRVSSSASGSINGLGDDEGDEPPQRIDRLRHCSGRVLTSFKYLIRAISYVLLFYFFLSSLDCASGHVLPSRAKDGGIASTSLGQIGRNGRIHSPAVDQRISLNDEKRYEFYLNTATFPTKEERNGVFFNKRQVLPTCTSEKHEIPVGREAAFAILVVILVLLSGVFAGLTLGYMSLDETQLQVLMTTGSNVQKARAAKIMPIRKDGHLLLTTLLIANMITNETLPIIFDPLLPNQVLSVVISTVLIVIFAELIPQSTCSRYGLQIGAYMAFPTRIIIIILWPIAWPVSRILHWVLGPHHGIVYRRAELKELVTMHAASGGRGGDLKGDTVMIVGGALDLQEKVVKQAMTPIDQVFMLPFTAKLDYPTLEKIVRSGHSRIPIYQEIEVQAGPIKSGSTTPKRKLTLLTSFSRKPNTGTHDEGTAKDQLGGIEGEGMRTIIRKKIIGTLLVKSCVLLDPEDAVPVSSMVINALPTVPADEPLLNVLNAFQEGRSHMAIVSPRPRRILSEGVADLGSKSNLYRSSQGPGLTPAAKAALRVDGLCDIDEEKNTEGNTTDVTRSNSDPHSSSHSTHSSSSKTRKDESPKRKHLWSRAFRRFGGDEGLEQIMPADATVSEKKLADFHELKKWESQQSQNATSDGEDGLPLGIITLEDVLEEILGEEILDEYDDRGNEEQDFRSLMPPPSPEHGMSVLAKEINSKTEEVQKVEIQPDVVDGAVLESDAVVITSPTSAQGPLKKTMLTRFGINRQRSQKDSYSSSPNQSVVALPDEPSNTERMSLEQSPPGLPHGLVASPSPMDNFTPNIGYFDGMPISTTEKRNEPNIRPASVPPVDRLEMEEVRGRSATRPPTPTTAPAIYSPQPSRAVVIRTQGPDGVPMTTIANENLLRGRQQSLPNTVINTSGIRSQTPVGISNNSNVQSTASIKGNRFKSQAAVGVGGSSQILSPTFIPPSIRSRSQNPTSTSPSEEDPATSSNSRNRQGVENDQEAKE